MWLFRKHVEKNWSYSVFPYVYSRQQVYFSNFCHDYMTEDSSKIEIRHKSYFEKDVPCGFFEKPQTS